MTERQTCPTVYTGMIEHNYAFFLNDWERYKRVTKIEG